MKKKTDRKYEIGAELVEKGVSFRVYAPDCQKVEVALIKENEQTQYFELKREKNGYFSKTYPEFQKNSHYAYRLNNSSSLLSDPMSRYQPQGPLGPSQVIDDKEFSWTDADWQGVALHGQIIYEMHLGTFTPEGTYAAAIKQLPHLAELGISVIEMMPVHEFPGKFGWGYDGVNLFAPYHLYGNPHQLKKFIDEAHRLKIAVILDVVYNHFGPLGSFIDQFSKDYFLKEDTEWGRAINFNDDATRLFYLTNVKYWIEEFHFDGLRLDATQSIFCKKDPHILAEISRTAHAAAQGRQIIIVGENEPQRAILMRSHQQGGYGLDGLWNDDFHHSALVRLTGKRQAYYTDYTGTSQELLSSIKHGFLYQGQYYVWQDKNRGAPALDIPYYAFIHFIQNHDQIANSGNGQRIHFLTDPGNLRAMTCLMIITPQIPMLFQGQEFGASSPFFYFADYADGFAYVIEKGRKKSLSQFKNLATEEVLAHIPPPQDPLTYIRCKLRFEERLKNQHLLLLHKDLIALKKHDHVFSDPHVTIDGAVLNQDAFLVRFFSQKGTRLLIINFGIDFKLSPAPEPLLAPSEGDQWHLLWSSESVLYEGQGNLPFEVTHQWMVMGHSAVIFDTIPL